MVTKKFRVTKREVWTAVFEVLAKDEIEAKAFILRGKGKEIDGLLEYSHTLNADTWDVEEVKDIA
jgi:hypothetical protein